MAVLRFENLTGDASLDWMGRGMAEAINIQLSGSPRIYAISFNTLHSLDAATGRQPLQAPGIAAERQQAILAGAERIVAGQYSLVQGTFRVDVAERDLATGRTVREFSESGSQRDGVIPLAGRIAGRLGDTLRPFGTKSEEALRQYANAYEIADPALQERALEQAVAADPGFGQAWAGGAELALGRHDRAGVERWLAEARSSSSRFTEFDRARLELIASVLDGDLSRRTRALTAMSRMAPADPTIYRNLAQIALQERRFSDALAAFRKVVAIEPENIESLNSLGYAAAVAGDLESATEALRRYAQLRPQDANPLDSLGDVHLYLGRLGEAEQYYLQAYQKSPGFLEGAPLLKAAYARLMTGDLEQADRLFARYRGRQQAARDPLVEFRGAEWSWSCGRRREGLAQLEDLARRLESGPLREIASEAYARLVFWNLELGDRAAARAQAEKAVAVAGPGSAGAARMAQFLSQPEVSSSEWAVRAERQFPEPGMTAWKQTALAYALLFAREFDAAATLLREMHRVADPTTDWALPVLLGWAYSNTGRWQEAAPLVEHNPIPQVTSLGANPSLWFPRIFFLRATILARQGKKEEARKSYQLFLNLSGPDAEIWGEEQKARQALGGS